ncbi:aminotransferase class I/II-fold pyridoxal phosphate-dependent enzyme [Haploplasma axanthum]|nr:aminotransferase class I/II-fold pyridoxal phosphate-dependent enzyme [Haploplasma axanthum]
MNKKQEATPFYSKLLQYANSNTTSHDVPGHKLGQIDNELLDYVGINMFRLDANAPRGLDNLNKPKTVIKEAAILMADAFGSDKAYFLTGGTTMGILAMIMAVCRANDKIIMPRNVHKSAINALILSGAVPVFVEPKIDENLGIANHVTYETYEEAIKNNLDAKAVFIINPTYFGVTTKIKEIVKLAHEHDMFVLADEAHGSHFKFSKELPMSAMKAGADIAACSLHKTVGSLTQSSIILTKGKKVDHVRLRSTINMLQSTSPSSLLLASLDVARKTIYFKGPEELPNIVKMAKKTRDEIGKIPGLKAITKKDFLELGAKDYDQTKIIVKVSNLGITGFQAYKELFDDFHIQLELAETHLILAVLSIGTKKKDLDALVEALKKLSERYYENAKPLKHKIIYTEPVSSIRPRVAYHAPKKYVRFKDALNEIAAEMIMIYPPGIPLVIPGEVITKKILSDLKFYQKSGSVILSDTDRGYVKIVDRDEWDRKEDPNEI